MNMSPSLDGFNLTRLVILLWRKKIPFIVMSAIIIIGFVLTNKIVFPDMYESEAMIKIIHNNINNDNSTLEESREYVGERGTKELILSRLVLEKVVDQLDLTVDTRPDWIAALVPTKPTLSNRVRQLRNEVVVTELDPDPLNRIPGSLFKISLRGKDPHKASQIVNAVVDSYIEMRSKIQTANRQRTVTFLSLRVKDLLAELHTVDKKLGLFKQHNADVLLAADTAALSLNNINMEIINTRSEIQELVSRRQKLQRLLAEEPRTLLPETARRRDEVEEDVLAALTPREMLIHLRNQLRVYESKYTGVHPSIVRVKRQIAELESSGKFDSASNAEAALISQNHVNPEYNRIREQLNIVLSAHDAAQRRLMLLQQQLNTLSKKMEKLSVVQQQLDVLNSQRDTVNDRYIRTKNRLDEEKVLLTATTSDVGSKIQVIEYSVPTDTPVGLSRMVVLLIGVLGSMVLSALVITINQALRDYKKITSFPVPINANYYTPVQMGDKIIIRPLLERDI